MMELYVSRGSVCCQKVQLVLAEKGLEPVQHALDLRAGEASRPDYLALNPNGVVPTLIDQGRPVIESTIICEYLEDQYPEPPLRPADALERADMRRWAQLPDTKVHEACGMVTFAASVRPEAAAAQIAALTDPVRKARLQGLVTQRFDFPPVAEKVRVYDQALADMAARLADHEWLAGSAYSLADIAMLPYVLRLADLGQAWMWEERPERGGIAAWLERCRARPNFEGISRWFSPEAQARMRANGAEARPHIEKALAAA